MTFWVARHCERVWFAIKQPEMTMRVSRHCEERSNPEILNINMIRDYVISRNEAIQKNNYELWIWVALQARNDEERRQDCFTGSQWRKMDFSLVMVIIKIKQPEMTFWVARHCERVWFSIKQAEMTMRVPRHCEERSNPCFSLSVIARNEAIQSLSRHCEERSNPDS